MDGHGRAIGGVAWRGKRGDPQLIPDARIEYFHERFDLAGQHVLEIGCFEGVHTIALCRLASSVTAVDARIENVAKTVVRAALYDQRPRVFVFDVESSDWTDLVRADLCHHVGVLYHLTDPVRHLLQLGEWIARGVMLDTHYARPEGASHEYVVDGRSYRYRRYAEHGRHDVFSGMQAESKWLLLDDITATLRDAGFDSVEVVERRARNATGRGLCCSPNERRATRISEQGREGPRRLPEAGASTPAGVARMDASGEGIPTEHALRVDRKTPERIVQIAVVDLGRLRDENDDLAEEASEKLLELGRPVLMDMELS